MDARSTEGLERPDLRHEIKLVTDEEALPRVRMLLRLDRAGLRTLYPPRLVQSLYLDTTKQRALEENLAGLSERRKLRLRWYGAGTATVQAHLELKCRANSLGWKWQLDLPEPLELAGRERRALVAELERRADPVWRERLAGLEPAQWVRYRREYLTTADRRVRVTIDRDLELFDQRLLARVSDRRRTPSPRVLVLEVKCAPEDLAAARDLIGRLPFPAGRCSKFVLASAPDSGPLVSETED